MSLFGGSKRKREIDVLRAQRPIARSGGAPGMNALVLGGGGREYAIAWMLARSDSVATVDAAPGNDGMRLFARTIAWDTRDVAALERYLAASQIDLAIVGPDDLVAAGLGDALRRTGVATVAPSRAAAKLEWSKAFAKEVMDEAQVPTAPWRAYPDVAAARAALDDRDGPVVVKADGLAVGKGVVVARDRSEALAALGSPHVAGGPVVLEDVLEGDECSLQTLVDGETVVALPPAKDHKRVGAGDTGPNTGGMGASSPTDVLPDDEAGDAARELVAPVARAMARRGTPYRGVLYAGLMRARDGWRVLEFNARFGDPEAEVTLPRVEGDFGRLMRALGDGKLAEHAAASPLRFLPRAYVDVVLCTDGYPATPRTGDVIEGLDGLPEGVYAFHAATRRTPAGWVTSGGRVLHIVASGDTVSEARALAYAGAEQIRFQGKHFRPDIAAPSAQAVRT